MRKKIYIYGYVVGDRKGIIHRMPLIVSEGYIDIIRRMAQRSYNTKQVYLSYGNGNSETIFT